jgi:signal transduction histidine kinase
VNRPSAPLRIALIVRHGGNRRRLHTWSKDTFGAEIVETIDDPDVDMLMTDPAGFVDNRSAIERRRRASSPVLLPCLLVCARRDAERLTTSVWQTIDDLVVTPIRPEELRLRIERLLSQRAQTAATEGERAELERSNVDLERFAFVAAHELVAPLAVVSGAIQTLDARFPTPDRTAQAVLTAATEGCRRMQSLIEDILDLSRAGRDSLRTSVDTDALVADVCQELRDRITDTGARVHYHDLPLVAGDAAELRLVFRNLIGNALKFRRPGIAPAVEVAATRLDTGWQFRVSDNGVGIAAADRHAVFELFARSDPSIPGSGIGLAICRRIIEQRGGRIWIEEREEPGTAFCFTLPD